MMGRLCVGPASKFGGHSDKRRPSGPQASSSPGKFADLIQQSYLEEATQAEKSAKKSEGPRRAPQALRAGLYDSLPSPGRQEANRN